MELLPSPLNELLNLELVEADNGQATVRMPFGRAQAGRKRTWRRRADDPTHEDTPSKSRGLSVRDLTRHPAAYVGQFGLGNRPLKSVLRADSEWRSCTAPEALGGAAPFVPGRIAAVLGRRTSPTVPGTLSFDERQLRRSKIFNTPKPRSGMSSKSIKSLVDSPNWEHHEQLGSGGQAVALRAVRRGDLQ